MCHIVTTTLYWLCFFTFGIGLYRVLCIKVGFSDYWRTPIHKTIARVKSNFPSLSWLRVSMSYHRFLNLRELFQGDLNTKLLKKVVSKDFKDLPCNCRNKKGCPYLGKCRNSIVVYQATDLVTNKRYIGNTQQHVKTRIQQHVQDTKRLFIEGKKSDSFANHFAKNIPEGTAKKEVKNHIKVKVDILWKGNALSCVKTFGTKHCKLCSKERLAILTLTRKSPQLAVNKCNEVHGACRHRPRFHRFDQSQTEANNPSTDESVKDERVARLSSETTSLDSARSTDSAGSLWTDQRESETFPIPPDGRAPFDFYTNRKNGLIARSELTKPDEQDVDSNLDVEPNTLVKQPPQEYETNSVDLDLADALNELSI